MSSSGSNRKKGSSTRNAAPVATSAKTDSGAKKDSTMHAANQSNGNGSGGDNSSRTTTSSAGAAGGSGANDWFSKRMNFSDFKSKVAQQTKNLFPRGQQGHATGHGAEHERKSKEQEWEKHLIHLFENFQLHGGPYIKDVVTANSDGRMLGGLGDEGVLTMRWYRASGTTNSFDLIRGIEGGFYQPSVDDIGARLLCQAANAHDEGQSGWAEWGPLAMDPEQEKECEEMIERGKAEFTVELVGTFDKHRQLMVTPESIVIEAPDEEEEEHGKVRKAPADGPAVSEEDLRKLADRISIPCSTKVTLYIDPVNVNQFNITLPAETSIKGLGESEEQPEQVKLKVSSNTERDSLAYLIRHFCGYDPNGDPKDKNAEDQEEKTAENEHQDSGSGTEQESPSGEVPVTEVVPGHSNDDFSENCQPEAAEKESETEKDRTIAELRKEVEDLTKKHHTVSEEKRQLKNEVKGMNNDITQLQKSLAEARRELEWKSRKLEKVSDQLEEMQAKDGESTASAQRYESELEERKQEVVEKSAQIKELTNKLYKSEANEKQYREELEDAKSKIESKDSELQSLQESLDKQKTETEQLQREKDNLRKQVNQLKETLTNSQNERDKLSSKLGVAQGALEEARESARLAGEQSKKDAAAASKAESELKHTKERLQTLEGENKKLREAASQHEQQAATAEQAEAEMERLKRRLEEESDSANEFRSERNSYKQKLSSMKKDIQRKITELYQIADIEQEKQSPLHQQLEKVNETLRIWKARMESADRKKEESRPDPSRTNTSHHSVESLGPHSAAGHSVRVQSSAQPHQHVSSGTSSSASRIDSDMQRIIVDLTDDLRDKDEALKQQRATKEALAKRIQELEEQLKSNNSS
eukprot:gb/GECG01007790.1/.p1 GENE.gb/GECG01007790.1/~~gb/GECG01007790.1/.p1  ORF type:complete len:873 (+),score=199.86 gb/GECG01007790.1/:1-2619(+)